MLLLAMVPKVSVLMCARNAERYVDEAIQSILRQTHGDFELIVVENASTDRTWEVLNEHKDSRLKLYRSQIPQLTFNLNLGLSHATGELIARMDADDVALPERLELQVQAMDNEAAVGVVGAWFEIFGLGATSKTVKLPLEDRDIRKAMPFRFVFCHPAVMFRRELVVGLGGYQGFQYCQDLELWLRIARDPNIKFKNLPKVLLRYRVHPKQARGLRQAYAASCAVLLREAIATRRPLLLAGAAWTWTKFFARAATGSRAFYS
jgi:O86/O127-antigen biosynthesis beta-1,3-galactosyltransferase